MTKFASCGHWLRENLKILIGSAAQSKQLRKMLSCQKRRFIFYPCIRISAMNSSTA